jgi:hypothetical protein
VIPGSEGLLSVGMALPELAQRSLGDDAHVGSIPRSRRGIKSGVDGRDWQGKRVLRLAGAQLGRLTPCVSRRPEESLDRREGSGVTLAWKIALIRAVGCTRC